MSLLFYNKGIDAFLLCVEILYSLKLPFNTYYTTFIGIMSMYYLLLRDFTKSVISLPSKVAIPASKDFKSHP